MLECKSMLWYLPLQSLTMKKYIGWIKEIIDLHSGKKFLFYSRLVADIRWVLFAVAPSSGREKILMQLRKGKVYRKW